MGSGDGSDVGSGDGGVVGSVVGKDVRWSWNRSVRIYTRACGVGL